MMLRVEILVPQWWHRGIDVGPGYRIYLCLVYSERIIASRRIALIRV